MDCDLNTEIYLENIERYIGTLLGSTKALTDYLESLSDALHNAGAELHVVAVVYLSRIINAGLKPQESTFQTIYGICILLAAKMNLDLFNRKALIRLSNVLNLTLSDIERLETTTLRFLNYTLFVSEDDYLTMVTKLTDVHMPLTI